MIIKHKNIEIDKEDIFKNDKLDREESIKNLSSLLSSTDEAFTLSVNASWGFGKTTFIKLLQAYLEKEQGVKSIYFSAWEDDFSKEPLISILGEINNYIESIEDNSEIVESFEKVKETGGKILKRAFPAFVKGVVSGSLDLDRGIEDAIGAMTESTAKELIEKYGKDKKITEEFINSIKDLLERIDDSKPFIIFIDELDRCRPTYAIELLERIKHIFGIDGLIFVLSIDKQQLGESIKSLYGNIDTDNYLKRFIDMEYSLKNPSLEVFCDYLYNDIFNLEEILKNKEISKKFHSGYDDLSMLKYLVVYTNMSLREIEHIFIELQIIFKTLQPKLFEIHFRVIIFFLIIKMKLPKQYKQLVEKEANADEIIDLLVSKKAEDPIKVDLQIIIKSIILASGKSEKEFNQTIKEQEELLNKLSQSDEDYESQDWLIGLLKDKPSFSSHYRLNKVIDTVIKKTEFADSFKI